MRGRIRRAIDALLGRTPPVASFAPAPVVLNLDAPLTEVRRVLARPLDVLLLGSQSDEFVLPHALRDRVRIFSIDAVNPSGGGTTTPIRTVVTGDGRRVTLVERAYDLCSSVLEPRGDVVRAFGLEKFFETRATRELESASIVELSRRHGVSRWHFIKTDLEGLDLEVIESLGEGLAETLLVQMEARFVPIFQGEPTFLAAATHLDRLGFDLLDLRTERWRYATPNAPLPTRGRAVHADALFVRRLVTEPTDVVAQAILTGLHGYVNFAEHLLAQTTSPNPAVRDELVALFFGKMRHPWVPAPDFPHFVGRDA